MFFVFSLFVHTVDLRTSASLSLSNYGWTLLFVFWFVYIHEYIEIIFCVIYSSWLDITVCALFILFVIKVKIFSFLRSLSLLVSFFFSCTFYIHFCLGFFFFFSLRANFFSYYNLIVTKLAHIENMQFVHFRCACVQFFFSLWCSCFPLFISHGPFFFSRYVRFHCVFFWCLSFISFCFCCVRARCLEEYTYIKYCIQMNVSEK
jgi:hypothetical protein